MKASPICVTFCICRKKSFHPRSNVNKDPKLPDLCPLDPDLDLTKMPELIKIGNNTEGQKVSRFNKILVSNDFCNLLVSNVALFSGRYDKTGESGIGAGSMEFRGGFGSGFGGGFGRGKPPM